MHEFLLNEQLIVDVVDSFADENDEITAEEMDRLPIELQYVDHKRSQSMALLNTLIEILAGVSI
jgi:hypothetical protein